LDFFHTSVSKESISRVCEVLQSTFLSEGKLVREFQGELQKLGLVNPVAVNSGTSALHLALDLADVGPGDEVVLPPQTFVASGLAVLMQRATPVFADIDPLSGNICTKSIREKITSRTKAIMPVHWAGYPCDMDEINSLAAEHKLAVVEDAAHALGAAYRGRPIGSISRFTAFSFQAIKHVTTGDGGALCCLSGEDARAALARRWFGIDRERDKPDLLGERVYDLDHVGYKYHMNDLNAAVGLGNLGDFPGRLARRRQIAEFYRERLRGVPGLQLLKLATDRTHAYWLFTMLVEKREDFIRSLAARGVPASVVHLRIDRNRVFGGAAKDLAGQNEFNDRQVSIPLHEGLSEDDLERVVWAVRLGW